MNLIRLHDERKLCFWSKISSLKDVAQQVRFDGLARTMEFTLLAYHYDVVIGECDLNDISNNIAFCRLLVLPSSRIDFIIACPLAITIDNIARKLIHTGRYGRRWAYKRSCRNRLVLSHGDWHFPQSALPIASVLSRETCYRRSISLCATGHHQSISLLPPDCIAPLIDQHLPPFRTLAPP